ncbi:hypothetical protein LIN45_24540 [Bacillus thuringiensis serovar kurstaki]|uniref:hypothetical protein n=1 Tax=Bacillus thuringiensis TaxID=1428 RepID=UPI001D18C6CA|nr:hypothetical protein [Bacillus thuringiensis]MCC3981938.1 hypothetical protein [Bacillus thuringiensis serovar kurstaki]
MSWNNDIFSDFLTLIFLAWFFSEMLAVPLLEEKWEKEKGAAGEQQNQAKTWASNLAEIFEKRKAKREES